MRIPLIYFLLFTSLHSSVMACECWPIDKESINQILDQADIIIIGHAVKNVNFNEEIRKNWDKYHQGFEVLIEVDSVLKGGKDLNKVIVNQLSYGNCSRRFNFDEPMVVYGNQITQFINKTPDRPKTLETEAPPTDVVPPPPSYNSGSTANCYNLYQEEIDYWNQLAKEETVLLTSLCTSYLLNSDSGQYFLK